MPQFGHEPWVKALLPHLRANHSLLFMGEGCGALFSARFSSANGKQDVVLGETNTLPYVARVAGPGAVSADRKSGGTFLAGLPAAAAEVFMSQLGDVWPYMSAAENVFETVLINYNAIDHVATILSNAGTIENRTGGMLLWGEGATPSVVRVIEAVDGELLSIRTTLGFSNQKRYRDLSSNRASRPTGPGPLRGAPGEPTRIVLLPDWSERTGDPLSDRGRAVLARARVLDRTRDRRPDPGHRRPHRDRLGHARPGLSGRGPQPRQAGASRSRPFGADRVPRRPARFPAEPVGSKDRRSQMQVDSAVGTGELYPDVISDVTAFVGDGLVPSKVDLHLSGGRSPRSRQWREADPRRRLSASSKGRDFWPSRAWSTATTTSAT